MTNLSANTGSLSTDTASIRREIQGMNRAAEQLRQTAWELNQMWDGKAKQAYLLNMARNLDNLDRALAELNRYAGLTEDSRTEYEQCEGAVGQVLSRLRI